MVVVGGGGVERHFSVQLRAKLKFWPRPKLNNTYYQIIRPSFPIEEKGKA